jgi:hypothetical protein
MRVLHNANIEASGLLQDFARERRCRSPVMKSVAAGNEQNRDSALNPE